MENTEGVAGRLYAYFLLALYALAWRNAATAPDEAMASLFLTSIVVTLPYFGWLALQGLFGGKMLVAIAAFIGLLIPILQFLVALVILLLLLSKIITLIENLPFILIGVGLYLLLWIVPGGAYDAISAVGIGQGVASLLVGAAGGVIFWFYLDRVRQAGRPQAMAAALALGFGCFLALFMLIDAASSDSGSPQA